MLFATYHNKKANNIATLALHRAMYFDDQTDLSDAHLDESHYLAKVPNVRAWGNSSDTNASTVTLSPMSGIKDNYFYPARSANLISGVNAALNLSTRQETITNAYAYISPTATPMQSMPAPNVAADHIVFVRPVGKRYSYSGLNQNTAWDVPTVSNGIGGYNRTDAAAFNMRAAVTGKSNTPDVTLNSCMMMFKCNGQGYMIRAKIGQDMTQDAPIATSAVATLSITAALPFGDKTLYLM